MTTPRGGFPLTRRSVVVAAASDDAEVRRAAFEALAGAYWKPVYKYVRLRWGADAHEAEDLTQGFFATAFEKGFFARYDPVKAKFRTYVRTCLDGFVSNERKAATRLKRGGGATLLSLDFETAEGELQHYDPPSGDDLDGFFRREWIRHLFSLGVDRLRERCGQRGKGLALEIFQAYDLEADAALERPSYAALAEKHGVPVTQVTNALSWARAEFRRLMLELLEEITGSEAEFRSEARAILGVDPS